MSRPTEADLGIEPTAEELEVLSRPVQQMDDGDDLPADTEDDDSTVVAKPAAETDEARAARLRDEAGKFVAKPKDDAAPGADAPKADAPPVDDRKVDLRALQEARAENKLLMERMTTLLEASQRREAAKAEADKPAAPARPDLQTEPLGFIADLDQRLTRFENETAAQTKARETAEAEHGEFVRAMSVAGPQFNEASEADPTLQPTYNALLESYAREIAYNNGIPLKGATQQQRDFLGQELTKLENGHIMFAVASGRNVAEYMSGLATARGISAPIAAPVTPVPSLGAPAPRPIAERQQQQQRHMSIGDLPGGAAPTTISVKDLLKMSKTEFAAFAKSMGDDKLDEMFGRA